jgi:hypothetical protein
VPAGSDWSEACWVLEGKHAMINGLARMGCRLHKTCRIGERAQ